MATLSKDEARRYRAAKHASRGEECVCGRMVYGNGGKVAHHRACRAYLEKYGWTFVGWEHAELRKVLWPVAQYEPQGQQGKKLAELMRQAALDEARRRGLIT